VSSCQTEIRYCASWLLLSFSKLDSGQLACRASAGTMIAAATRCKPTSATLLTVVSANVAGRHRRSPSARSSTRQTADVEQSYAGSARQRTPADDSGHKCDLGETRSGILPSTASGTPAARRPTAPTVVTTAATTPTETVVRASVPVNHSEACSAVTWRNVATKTWLSFRSAAVPYAHSPCPRTARAESTPKLLILLGSASCDQRSLRAGDRSHLRRLTGSVADVRRLARSTPEPVHGMAHVA